MADPDQNTTNDIEFRKITLEEQRLVIERERLALERRRSDAEEEERKHNNRFFQKHFGEVLAAAVTLAGVLVSGGNIIASLVQKSTELKVQTDNDLARRALQHVEATDKLQHDMERSRFEQDYKLLEFVDKHSDQLFSTKQEDVDRTLTIMTSCMDPHAVVKLIDNLKRLQDERERHRLEAEKDEKIASKPEPEKTKQSEKPPQPQQPPQKTTPSDFKQWVKLAGEAKVDTSQLLDDKPPPVSAGQVPITATSCSKFGTASSLNTNQCRIACWDNGQVSHYNVNNTVSAESDAGCVAMALQRCRQAGNSFCGYAWKSP